VPIDLVDPTTNKLHSLRSITDRLTRQHARYVLEGDYGSGKSMTLRELFFQAVDNYKQGRTRQFPVFLNLRDHGGQTIPQKLSTGTGGGWE
jgi:predicted NACHT family NTPase